MRLITSKIILGTLLCFVVITVFSSITTPLTAHAQQGPTLTGAALAAATGPLGALLPNPVQAVANSVDQSILASLRDIISQSLARSAYTGLFISSWIVTLVGSLFDEVLRVTVVNLMANLGSSSIINTLWADVRSLGNIVFIFMAIYVAIKTIIGQGGDDTKRIIRNLIIVALLVNFSLFFTKLLIDGSNIFTLAFYNLTLHSSGATVTTINGLHTPDSFTTVFAKPLGLSTIYAFSQAGASSSASAITSLSNLSFGTILLVGIGGSIFLLITAVTFGAVAILFLTRFILLIFLMVLSPLAFLFFALPSTQENASKWWRMLAGQLTFGIVYMLLIWFVALLINRGFQVTNLVNSLLAPNGQVAASNSFATVLTSGTGVDQILFFLTIIGLMVAALYLAVTAASYGNALVGKAVNKISGFAVNGAAALGGKAYRGTVGAAAEKLTGDGSQFGEKIRGMRTSNNFVTRAIGRQLDKRATAVRDASGDLRNTKTFQNLSTKAGLTVNKGVEGGYRTRVEAEEKELVEYAKKGGAATQKTMEDLQNSKSKLSATRLELAKHIATAQEISEERLNNKLAGQKVVDQQTGQERNLTEQERQIAKQAARKIYRDKRDALSKSVRDTETDIKKTEKIRDNERKAGQTGLLTHWADHSTRVSLVSGMHKASVEGAVDRFLTKEKAADKGAEDKERTEGYADNIRDAIAAGDEAGIQAAIESVPDKDLSKLPKDAQRGGFKYLPEHVQKNFLKSKDLSEADRKALQKTQAGAKTQTPKPQDTEKTPVPPTEVRKKSADQDKNQGPQQIIGSLDSKGEYDLKETQQTPVRVPPIKATAGPIPPVQPPPVQPPPIQNPPTPPQSTR